MMNKYDFIIFGFNDWHHWAAEGFRTRSGVISKKLSEHPSVGKVLVISTQKSIWKNLFRLFKGGNVRVGLARLALFSLEKVSDKVYVLDHTRVMPREDVYGSLYSINSVIHDRLLTKKIRSLINELKMKNPILWISNPLMAKHIGNLGERLSIFDSIDDWEAFPEKMRIHKSIKRGYEFVKKRADIIFTVSESLVKKLGHGRTNVYCISNGIDTNLFKPDKLALYSLPDDLRTLPKPIIGYVGVMQDRVDTAAIAKIALRISTGSVVLIGPMVKPVHFSSLDSYKNVHFLGEKHHDMIPAYLKYFDICVLPHKNNSLTRSMNPLKLYEYIAMEKPVVVTDHPGLEEFDGLIKRAGSADEFAELVHESVLAERNGFSEKCRKFVEGRDWDKKIEEMLDIINHELAPSELRSAKK